VRRNIPEVGGGSYTRISLSRNTPAVGARLSGPLLGKENRDVDTAWRLKEKEPGSTGHELFSGGISVDPLVSAGISKDPLKDPLLLPLFPRSLLPVSAPAARGREGGAGAAKEIGDRLVKPARQFANLSLRAAQVGSLICQQTQARLDPTV
jgi:hypothetical protein